MTERGRRAIDGSGGYGGPMERARRMNIAMGVAVGAIRRASSLSLSPVAEIPTILLTVRASWSSWRIVRLLRWRRRRGVRTDPVPEIRVGEVLRVEHVIVAEDLCERVDQLGGRRRRDVRTKPRA